VQRRTAPKTMAWWLFYFVSRCGFTVLWVVLFLQARNGCPSVFLSFSALSLCLCVREESFWVGWTQAFSGSLLWFCPCFCSSFLSSCFCFLPRFCSFLPLVFGSNSPLFCLSVSPCSSPQFSPCSSPLRSSSVLKILLCSGSFFSQLLRCVLVSSVLFPLCSSPQFSPCSLPLPFVFFSSFYKARERGNQGEPRSSMRPTICSYRSPAEKVLSDEEGGAFDSETAPFTTGNGNFYFRP